MHDLFTIPFVDIKIGAYAFFLVSSFIIGAIWSGYRARSEGLDPDTVPDMAFWIFVFAMIGARVFMIMYKMNRQNVSLTDIKTIAVISVQGGMVAYGGMVFAVLTAVVYAIVKKVNLLSYLNVFAPPFALGIALVRIGCFLNGCCYGKECNTFPGVTFPPGSPGGIYQAQHHISALFPSQLLESFAGFLILAIIMVMERAFRIRKISFYLVFTLYSVARFVVDFTRVYPDNDRLLSLTNNQWVCVSVFFLGSMAILATFIRGLNHKLG